MKKILAFGSLVSIAAMSHATLYTFDSGTISIIDFNPAATANFNVGPLDGNVVSVELLMSGFSHTFADDTGAVLADSAGNALRLFDGPDDDEVQGANWLFTDSASSTLDEVGPNASGSYLAGLDFWGSIFTNAPAQNVSSFAGLTGGTGTWSLYVEDFVSGDTGSIQNAQLRITTDAVPEPFTMVGLAAVAALGIRRKRK